MGLLALLLTTTVSAAYMFSNVDTLFNGTSASGESNLVITGVKTDPLEPTFGSQYDAIVTVKNIGTAPTTSRTRSFVVGVTGGTRTATARATADLAPGAERQITIKRLKATSVYAEITAKADYSNSVRESNENDNTMVYKFVQTIPGATPQPSGSATPTPSPSPTPISTPVIVSDSNLVVFQEVGIARPDETDPNNYYYFRIVGSVQNNNRVPLTNVVLTSSFETWYSSILQPKLIDLQVLGLPENPTYNGVTDLYLTDRSQTVSLAAMDNDHYGPDQAQIVFDIRVKRYSSDVTVKNLLTFRAWSVDANKGLFSQSLIPLIVPAKVVN